MAHLVSMLLGVVVLTGALVMVPLSQMYTYLTSSIAKPADTSLSEPQADSAETYRGAISSLLQGAGDEIQDNDLSHFYLMLLSGYEINGTDSKTAQTQDYDSKEILPDINKIYRAALTLPLEEAGKNIRDKEIAEFYYQFLRDAGWTIEAN